MPTKEKAVNYTPEMEETMTTMYKSALGDTERKEMVQTISDQFKKTPNSVRAKLSKLGVYIKAKATSKSGAVIVRKAELVHQLAELMDVDEDLIGSLEKATKFSLEKIISNFQLSNRIIADLEASE